MFSDTLQFLRLLNVVLAVACTGMFFVRVNDVWRRLTSGGRVLRVGLFLMLFALTGASGGAYLAEVPVGFWVPMITVSLLVVMAGLFLSRNDYK